MQGDDFLNIVESDAKYSLENLIAGSQEMLDLFSKNLQKYITRAKFWKPRLEIGKKCMNYMRREVFTEAQRAKYRIVEKKWPIELQLMKRVINTLGDKIEDAIPGADITYEDDDPPTTAAKPEVMKTVLTWMKNQLSIQEKRKHVLRDGLITGYPIVLWFERVRGITSTPGLIPLIPSVLTWDSVLPDPFFDENKGINDLTFIKEMTTKELYDMFPNRKKEHLNHLAKFNEDQTYRDRLLLTDQTKTADDRKSLIYQMVQEGIFNSSGGHYFLMQNVFPITTKRRAWIDTESDTDVPEVFIPPEDWTDFQRQSFLENHPEFKVSANVDTNILWVTIVDSSGFVWENNQHWYQEEGELPAAIYVADMIDNVPCGAGEDRLPYVLLASACATEGLDQVRRGTGRLTAVKEGAVKKIGSLKTELSASEGVAVISHKYDMDDSIKQFTRSPNTVFLEMQDRIEDQLENVDGVPDSWTGASNPRQSEKAKRFESKAALSPHSPYVDNYQKFTLKLENLLCKFAPRVLTEQMVIRLKDEYGQAKEDVTVNQTEFDYSGEALRVANDIVSARYRAVASVGDDSVTSRESQQKEFIEILEAVGNQLFQLDPILLANIFSTYPNIFARETAKFLREYGERASQAAAQEAQEERQLEENKQLRLARTDMEKVKRPKVAIKLDPQSLQDAPEGAKILYHMMKQYESESEENDAIERARQFQQATNGQPQQQEMPEEAVPA